MTTFKKLALAILLIALVAVVTGCDGDDPVTAQYQSDDGRVVINGPQDGVVNRGPDGTGSVLETDDRARRLADKLKGLLDRVRDGGILNEISRELIEAGIVSTAIPADAGGNSSTGTGDAGGNSSTATGGATGNSPTAIARMNIIVEIMADMPALVAQIDRDLPQDQADRVRRQFFLEQQAGTFAGAVTYTRPDGTVVIKFLAFQVVLKDAAFLLATIIHELAHAEIRGYDITNRPIDPPVDQTGHGGKWAQVNEKLQAMFAEWQEAHPGD